MILASLNCKSCKSTIFNLDIILEENSNEYKNGECEHFNYCCNFFIREQKFLKSKIIITCKNCEKCFDEEYIENSKNLTFKCGCGFECSFIYELSDESEIIKNIDNSKKYKTPDNDNKEEIKDKTNIIFMYENKHYSYVINENETIISQYRAIRDRIKFPDGKKLYNNGKMLDVYRTFKNNELMNNMKVEII
jgi:hypothetical protein